MSHKELVRKLSKPGNDILQSLSPEKCSLLHGALGISGEAGEIVDAIKKHVMYQKPLDIENVKEELGDILFYMLMVMEECNLSLEEITQHNIDKLSIRYKDLSYSNEAAVTREDKVE